MAGRTRKATQPVATKAIWEYSIKRKKAMYFGEGHWGTRAETIAEFLRAQGLGEREQECFAVVYLDIRHAIRGYSLVTVGLVNRVNVHAREAFRTAILLNAERVVLAHNHPSGNSTPSKQDREHTRSLVAAGRIIGIDVVDHIILGESVTQGQEYFSFHEAGLMDRMTKPCRKQHRSSP